MTHLLRAEVRKLRSVRTTWAMTALGFLLVIVSTSVYLFVEEVGGTFTGADEEVAAAIDQIGSNAIIVLIVAILAVTTEFRHKTIGRTLQITSSRARVLVAKVAVAAGYGVAFFVMGLALVAVLVAVAAGIEGVSVDVGGDVATALWRGPVGLVLNAALGVAIGALLRSQVLTLTLTLVWLFVAETLVNALVPEVARWLPFQALNALFLSEETLDQAAGAIQPLDPPVALAVFVAYVVLAGAAATTLLTRRDV